MSPSDVYHPLPRNSPSHLPPTHPHFASTFTPNLTSVPFSYHRHSYSPTYTHPIATTHSSSSSSSSTPITSSLLSPTTHPHPLPHRHRHSNVYRTSLTDDTPPSLLLPHLKSIQQELSTPSSSSTSHHLHSTPSSHFEDPTFLHSHPPPTKSMTTSSSTSTLPPTTPTTTATTTKSSSSTNNSVPHPTHPTSSHGPEDHPRHSMSLKNVRTSLALDAINAPDRTYMYRTNRSSEVDVLYQRLSQVQTEKIETQYTLQFQHEVLVRPEETSPQTCLLEIVKQVHVFLQFREEIVLVLQTGKWLPYEFNSHPDMCFGTLEQVAERLVRLWNEFLFTTRPLTQSRAMYVKPSVTQEQPFSIFGLFSKLEDLTEHQAMLLVKRSSMNLDEWVGLRNVLVLLNERAKCSKEMKF